MSELSFSLTSLCPKMSQFHKPILAWNSDIIYGRPLMNLNVSDTCIIQNFEISYYASKLYKDFTKSYFSVNSTNSFINICSKTLVPDSRMKYSYQDIYVVPACHDQSCNANTRKSFPSKASFSVQLLCSISNTYKQPIL